VFARSPSLGTEIHTVEASPETVTAEHVAVLRERGIGRVSMGIQSLDDAVLDRVNRRHRPEQALDACDLLVGSGLLANVDLIYGLPGQSEESFRRDLATIAGRGVHSVTLYDLRVNERTPVVNSLADHERLVLERLMRWRVFVAEAAREVGFVQTRWHTFRRPDGPATRHQRAAHFRSDGWGFQLGVGMSARSHMGYSVYRNHPQLPTYLDRVEKGMSAVEEVFELSPADRKTQFVARSLGDGRPLVRAAYEAAFGTPIEVDFGEVVARLTDAGLVDDDGTALTLSQTGRLVYDRITLAFYPPEAKSWLYGRRLSAAPSR
jgi:oxygen-independent coproporphyrinogen III oxidase